MAPHNRLTREFDALLADMQRPASRRAMKTAFGASPKQLGRAAAAAAKAIVRAAMKRTK